jgi:ABC-type multidrug transport system ATPase subunit
MIIEVIYGPSGVGKTTLLKRLFDETDNAAFHDASQEVFGSNIHEMLLIDKEHLSANKIIHFLSKSFGINLAEVVNRSSYEFSLGQQKRIAFIRNMLGDKKYKYFDEPFSHVDQKAANQLIKFVLSNNLFQNSNVIFTSHHNNFDRICKFRELT